MNVKLGIRYEDRFKMERRVAIIPEHVEKLIHEEQLEIFVEKSEKRVFSDEDFQKAGARLKDDVREAPVIFGVKEMPLGYFEENKTYIFFSHTIKGQQYNMAALKEMVDKKVNLIDYEKVADENGRRLIFFGRFAGLAGMINSLWSLGLRLDGKGIDNPFSRVRQSHTYSSLQEALLDLKVAGNLIREGKLKKLGHPLVIAFTGYGNVSKGAQEILENLPTKEIDPEILLNPDFKKNFDPHFIYKVVFKEKDLVMPKSKEDEFELQDYYNYPGKYKSVFDQYIDKINVLMNCMYWDAKYPRLITKDYLKENYTENFPLQVIGDITCDPQGSIECTYDCTKIESPNFIYDPVDDEVIDGNEGRGILIMAVDILPSELPLESSKGFSSALFPFIGKIVKADYSKEYTDLDLPDEIKRALILHNGDFTPPFEYMEKYLQ